MIAILLLLAFPDIKQVPIDDEMLKDFSYSESIDETTTDCTQNPSSGGPMSLPLKLELTEPSMPENTGIVTDFPLMSTHDDPPNRIIPYFGSVTSKPDLEPDLSPMSLETITPEPPPVIIVGMTAAMMLFLLFGRRMYKKFQ